MSREDARLRAANSRPGKLAGFDCPKCLNRGYSVKLGENGELISVPCECMETRKSIQALKKSGLENLIEMYRFGNYVAEEEWQKTALEDAKKFAADPGNGWFILGGVPGSGKTHLGVAICRELMMSGRSTKYMMWRDEITNIKAAVTDEEEYNRLVDPAKRASVLYIDDFFKVGGGRLPTSADISVAFEILNYRYVNKGKTTIISTELSMNDLLTLDEAVGSRIYERCEEPHWFSGEGKNWRINH